MQDEYDRENDDVSPWETLDLARVVSDTESTFKTSSPLRSREGKIPALAGLEPAVVVFNSVTASNRSYQHSALHIAIYMNGRTGAHFMRLRVPNPEAPVAPGERCRQLQETQLIIFGTP